MAQGTRTQVHNRATYVLNLVFLCEQQVGGSEKKLVSGEKVRVENHNCRKKQKLCHTASVHDQLHQCDDAETKEALNSKVRVNIESKEKYNKSNEPTSKKNDVVELSSDDSSG